MASKMENCLYPCSFMGQLKKPLHLPKILRSRQNRYIPLNVPSDQYVLSKAGEEYLYNHVIHYILSKEQLKECGYPYRSPDDPSKAICNPSMWEKEQCSNERICSRCSSPYSSVVQDGKSLSERSCQYHKYRCKAMLVLGTVKRLYPCCGKEEDAPGCQWSLYHVSNCYRVNSESFVSTKKNDVKKFNSIYSLDCEMCYTLNGLEVTRVSVVSCDGTVVYETYVLPEAPIIDYNTNFSGITAEDLKDVTVTLPEVQDKLLQLFDSDTILVGHALENDLKGLRIIHEKIIDTSVLFPHECGWPYRRSLKSLASMYLYYSFRQNNSGHDSIEDARTCLDLLFAKIRGCC